MVDDERAMRPGVDLVERVGDELLIVGPEPAPVLETAITLRDVIDLEMPHLDGVEPSGRTRAPSGR